MAARKAAAPRRLKSYRSMRDFTATTEPRGGARTRKAKQETLSFVIQKHAARRLHYDFRLEWKGTLRSWAVPKGPSLDPADKRLAVEVEDHPLEYGKFEGDIPKGHYGAGHVDRWDYGTWEPIGDAAKGFAKGHLEFELHGQRLHGRWNLVRTRLQGGKQQWLLIKGRDAAARTEHAAADDIEAARPLKPALPRARAVKKSRKSRLPQKLEPELATLVSELPAEPGWVYELKYDGVRLLCRADGAEVKCLSRNGLDWTHRVTPVVEALAELELPQVWLDGELIVTDSQGRSDFSLLQRALEQGELNRLVLCLFDILYFEGQDLRDRPLQERQQILGEVVGELPPDGPLRFADRLQASGEELLQRVCRSQLEGLIAKRVDSTYRAGRSKDWLKIKCRREQEFVVGGASFMPGRKELSSLLVGVRDKGKLRYVGRVGGGFNNKERTQWHERVLANERKTSPFANLPERRAGERWRWMDPDTVIQVAFASWTTDGYLRQPRFLGIRADREPGTVVREEPQPLLAKHRGFKLSHPEKVLFPQDGVTKLQLAEYYDAVGEWMLPHVKDRPLSVVRFTSGGAQPFYQKHFLKSPLPGLKVVDIEHDGKTTAYAVVTRAEGLIQLAQLGGVELHTWGALARDPDRADRLTLDIDPDPKLPYERVREAALMIKRLLESMGLVAFVKTTGGKGLHVVTPLAAPLPDWETAKSFTLSISRYLEGLSAADFTSKTGERNRQRKIFVDYLRNGFGATAVAAFSTRWRKHVPVSVPLAWADLDEDRRGEHFTLANVPRYLRTVQTDPWKDYEKSCRRLSAAALKKIAGLSA